MKKNHSFAEDTKNRIFAALRQWYHNLSVQAMDRRELIPAWNADITTAEAGILHMLGARYEYEAVSGMAHLGMKEQNISHWLCDNNPKAQVFGPTIARGSGTIKNPYHCLSKDIVEQAKQNLLARKLIQITPEHDKDDVRLMICNTGLALTPFTDQVQGAAQESPSDKRLRASEQAVQEILNRPVGVPRMGVRKPDSDKREK